MEHFDNNVKYRASLQNYVIDTGDDVMGVIQPCSLEHVERYGEIYAKAFSGEPWNDPWDPADAVIHV